MDGQQQENPIRQNSSDASRKIELHATYSSPDKLVPDSCDAAIRAGNLDAADSKR
jgi:hypothetical protein